MAAGDLQDVTARLRAALPRGWFPDVVPALAAVLTGCAAGFSRVYGLLQFVRAQTRLATVTGIWVDTISSDFFGLRLPRMLNEGDRPFAARIAKEVVRPRNTRAAVIQALTDLGCGNITVFEPRDSGDTGTYGGPYLGYGVAGGYGSVLIPFQFFVTCTRPLGGGIANIAGYGTGGYLAYGSLSLIVGEVTDADIYAAVASVLPAGTDAWVRLSGAGVTPAVEVARVGTWVLGSDVLG